MKKKMNRRTFIKKSAAIGAVSVVSGSVLSGCAKNGGTLSGQRTDLDISIVKGADYSQNAIRAVEQLGGIEAFVPQNAKVAILANPQRNNPGSFTSPKILKATIQMCKNAGASKVSCISQLPDQNWMTTGLKKIVEEEGSDLIIADRNDENQFKTVPIPNGIALKEAQVMNAFFDYDVFIDMPITKDHAGNKFTGTMKNLMGLTSRATNRTFHKEGWQTEINAIDHLEQCIADLNTIIMPTLCIVDATEFIITNGPFGPGEILKPQKVIVGTDRVAIDSYCCTLWGLSAQDILQIKKAHRHGLGEIEIQNVKIKETQV